MRLDEVSRLVAQKLEQIAHNRPDVIMARHKALGALFPYVVRLEEGGHQEMVEMFTRIAVAVDPERFMWDRIELGRVLTLASPHVPWGEGPYEESVVTKWALAASVIPYTEDVGRSVVDVLLHTASVDSLRPHIPAGIWAWLKKQPPFPSRCPGWPKATNGAVVRRVRALRDSEVLEAYFLHVWSEWNCVDSLEQDSGGSRSGLVEMRIAIQEELGGVGMGRCQESLIHRLDHILEELGRGLGYLGLHKPDIDEGYVQTAKEQYEGLRKVLLEVHREVENTLASMSPRFILFGPLTLLWTCRIPFDLYVRSPAPVSMIPVLKRWDCFLRLSTSSTHPPRPVTFVRPRSA